MEFSRCARAPTEPTRRHALSRNSSADGLSKLNSVDAELDVLPGESHHRTAAQLPMVIAYPKVQRGHHRHDAYRSNSSGIP